MKVLVTGAAGFIGYHLCEKLLKEGHYVVGVDNINDYYDVNLKYARLYELGVTKDKASVFGDTCPSDIHFNKFVFYRMDIENRIELPNLFKFEKFDLVVNLAAQAGVRYSIENPNAYIDSNVVGFLNILECCRNNNVKKLLYASSSSVYGNSDDVPFLENQSVDRPISLYAATKKSNELMAHTYSHLFKIETIGLRFFTVYGPWGRPDMAMFLFTDAIFNDKPIRVFNNGNLSRDFTYIDDIIDGVYKLVDKEHNLSSYKIFNIGNSKPVFLLDFINAISIEIGKVAKSVMLPMQPGDVNQTWADTSLLANHIDYDPLTNVVDGVKKFVDWYREFYQIDNL